MSIASELTALNGYILGAYNAIDTKGGTIPQNKNMENLPDAIDSIPSGGGGANNWSAVMQGDTTDLYDNDILSLRNYATAQSSGAYSFLTSVSFPNLEELGNACFMGNAKLTSANLPKVSSMGASSVFQGCSKLVDIKLPSLQTNDATNKRFVATFYQCANILKIDLGNNTISSDVHFHTSFTANCTKLEALIIRWNNLITITQTSAISNNGITSGTGYIYVPKSLVASYQGAPYWSTYASQIRAIEDYSDDGTVEGNITV